MFSAVKHKLYNLAEQLTETTCNPSPTNNTVNCWSNGNLPLSSVRHLTLAYLLAFTHKIQPFSARLERERVMLMEDRGNHND